MSLWVQNADALLLPQFTDNDVQIVINAVYKQVLRNAYLVEGASLMIAESLLRNKNITVRGFVRLVGQSELYQSQLR